MPSTSILDFDELNNLKSTGSGNKKNRSIPYKDFFGIMQITDTQKRERIALAEDIEDAMLVLFVLLPEYIDRVEELQESVYKDLFNAVSERVVIDDQIDKHLKKMVEEVVQTTIKNLEKSEYWLSQDRATLIAENEANTVFNHSDYIDAVASGCTQKRWLTELDDRVRPTHLELEQETIDIDDVFVVGDSVMQYPHDLTYEPDPSEIINCRCVCEYL